MSSPLPAIHSALASPRSSTSSSEPSNPPLTPMFDLEKQVDRMVVTEEEKEEEHAVEASGVLSTGSSETPVKQGSKPTGKSGGPSPMPHFSPSTQAYRTRTLSGDEARSQFATFTFGGQQQPPPSSPGSRGSSFSYRAGGPSSPSLPSPTRGTGLTASNVPGSGPSRRPYPSPTGPQEGFSFGTCPSAPLLNTPTAEMGAFEYPEHTPGSPNEDSGSRDSIGSSHSMQSNHSNNSHRSNRSSVSSISSHPRTSISALPLGESHRRNSIISRPSLAHAGSSSSTISPDDSLSPPQTRRSSTCSTIVTLPVAGRRPSILHSITVEGGAVPSVSALMPSASTSDAHKRLSLSASSPLSAPNTGGVSGPRRGSLMFPFPAKPLASPVPPSLLARRGSLPARQLLNMPSPLAPLPPGDIHSPEFIHPNLPRSGTRSSFSAATYGVPGQITAHSLYNRRDSILSEGSSIGSSGSGGTVMGLSGPSVSTGSGWMSQDVTRRSSLRGTPLVSGRSSLAAEEGIPPDVAEGRESSMAANDRPGRSPNVSGTNVYRRASMPATSLSGSSRNPGQTPRATAAKQSGPSVNDAQLASPLSSRPLPLHLDAQPGSHSSRQSPRSASMTGAVPNVPSYQGSTQLQSPSTSSPSRGYRMRQSGQWSARPSLSGRSLSSSEESSEENNQEMSSGSPGTRQETVYTLAAPLQPRATPRQSRETKEGSEDADAGDGGDVTDEVESLPTPGTSEMGPVSGSVPGYMSFKDPWESKADVLGRDAPSVAQGQRRGSGSVRRPSAGGIARPILETIESHGGDDA